MKRSASFVFGETFPFSFGNFFPYLSRIRFPKLAELDHPDTPIPFFASVFQHSHGPSTVLIPSSFFRPCNVGPGRIGRWANKKSPTAHRLARRCPDEPRERSACFVGNTDSGAACTRSQIPWAILLASAGNPFLESLSGGSGRLPAKEENRTPAQEQISSPHITASPSIMQQFSSASPAPESPTSSRPASASSGRHARSGTVGIFGHSTGSVLIARHGLTRSPPPAI